MTESSSCEIDHHFNGSENEVGIRPGEEGPAPPNHAKTQSDEVEYRRLKALIEGEGLR